MRKRIVPKALTFALAVSLAANLVVFAVAGNATGSKDSENTVCPTREEFFTAIAKSLGIEGEMSYYGIFPDYQGLNGYINEMISKGYLIGRNTGLLDLDDVITVEDMNYVMNRIEWPKEEVEVEKPIFRTVEVPVMQNLPYDDEALQCEHLFYLASDGSYKCAYKNCNLECPIGTMLLPSIPVNLLSNLGLVPGDSSVLSPVTSVFLDKESVRLDDGMMQYPVACNAECYSQENSISIFELFELYGSYFGSEVFYDAQYHMVESEGVDYIDWINII